MADKNDRTVLLSDQDLCTAPEDDTQGDESRSVSSLVSQDPSENEKGGYDKKWAEFPPPTDNPLGPLSTPSQDIISIFIVAFDSKEGNLLEWHLPQEVNLEGVEFRALISGAHTITSDFIYFRQGDYYGVACYEKREMICDAERGARMKSVGVIVSSYNLLYQHLNFLKQQVRKIVTEPGVYGELEEYYEERRALIPSSWDTPQKATYSPRKAINSPQKATHSLSHSPCPKNPEIQEEELSSFLSIYGEQTMALWRATLLRKRVLLLSTPPIGPACSRVRAISLLSAHTTPGLPVNLLRPLFYISLADIEILQEQHSYVACTTERIFEEKSGICDIFVENKNIQIPENYQNLLTITPEDRKHFVCLKNITRSAVTPFDAFHSYFSQLNDRIFATLRHVCSSNGVVTKDDIMEMGLNAKLDRDFVKELADTHGFDITVSDSLCASCC